MHDVHRDGSAVELVGLCASVTRWLADMSDRGQFPYSGVKRSHGGDDYLLRCFG